MTEKLKKDANDLIDAGRDAVRDGENVVGDAIDDTRDEPVVVREARKVGRRVDQYREDYPTAFGVAVGAVAGALVGVLVGVVAGRR
ncbi:hypothetical protein EV140_1568 [Microcella alkaliphila]|uniref:DUF883 domain-containing protein n=1 Tax=Microcella alkaliphila TaxID=279828 RepID=A0A4Q7TJD8_9MICO|nr:hypothetical protein [Microcella alkaliphila]RZT59588.1 hypothetical protein EV140_1568 [Microcella alkaliphila]